MKYMQISIVKKQKNDGNSTGYIKNHRFYNLKWFKNPAFRRSDSLKDKKDYIRDVLSKVDLSEKNFGPIFDKEERVIVNVQGRPGLDNAIFDEEMILPENLIDSNKKHDEGGQKQW